MAKYHSYGWYLSRTRISRISRIYFFVAATGILIWSQWKNSEGVEIREIREIRVGKINIQHYVARSHLMRWIVRCTQLYEQLLKSGYTKNSKEFNPLQVSYIFFHLGEP